MSVMCQGKKENKIIFFLSIKSNNKMLNFNISQIHRQLLVGSVAEDMTQYPLCFFLPFVPTVRDV